MKKVTFVHRVTGKKKTANILKKITFRKKLYFYLELADGKRCYKRTDAVIAAK
jgi:hypothetical protein